MSSSIRIAATVVVFLIIFSNASTAFAVHKYASPTHRAQDILNVEVSRLVTSIGPVPIAVTSENDRLTLYWWHEQTSRWRYCQRFHEEPESVGRRARNITDLDWSHRVGLASGALKVFMVYQRRPVNAKGDFIGVEEGPQIYADVFEWNTATNRWRAMKRLRRDRYSYR